MFACIIHVNVHEDVHTASSVLAEPGPGRLPGGHRVGR